MTGFIGQCVLRGASNIPSRTAVLDATGNRVTWSALDEYSTRLANVLVGSGLRQGARVAVWMDDIWETVAAYVAVSRAGLVAVTVGKALTPHEATHILDSVSAEVVIFSPATAERLQEVLDQRGLPPFSLLLGARDARCGGSSSLELSVSGASSTPLDGFTDEPDPIALVGFTSGTTGFPKGAVIRESALRAITAMSAHARRLLPYGTGVLTASLSFPAIVPADLFTHLWTGGGVCLAGRWDPDKALDLVAREAATYMYLPTPCISDFAGVAAQHPDKLRTLETVMHGGSKASPEILERLYSVIGDRFVEIWGMMENSGGPITCTTKSDLSEDRGSLFDSVGRPLPTVQLAVMANDGSRLSNGPDRVGEVLIKTPALFDGYWNMGSRPEYPGMPGYFATGDLGWLDERGRLHLVERRKDLIISGGANVYPSEIERVLRLHPAVKDAAVVGVPDDRWGNVPCALVIVHPGQHVGAQDILDHCRAHLAGYKNPKRVVFIDALPVNSSGKVSRKDLHRLVDEAGLNSELSREGHRDDA